MRATMARIFLVLLISSMFTSEGSFLPPDYKEESLPPNDPCSPKQCEATFNHAFSVPVTLPCSMASGSIPAGPHLPLIYPGDFNQCERVFGWADGHFCTIDTEDFLAVPLRRSIVNFTGEGFVLGRLHLGRCVSKNCTASRLRTRFLKGLHQTAAQIRRRTPYDLVIPYLEERIKQSTVVRCVDESEAELGSVLDHGGPSMTAIFLALIALLVLLGSASDSFLLHSRTTTWAHAVSLERTISSLVRPSEQIPDFGVLNGIRSLSMLWIVSRRHLLICFLRDS
jgi:hypothetical protein